jgi:hypothetical protein
MQARKYVKWNFEKKRQMPVSLFGMELCLCGDGQPVIRRFAVTTSDFKEPLD